MTRHSRIVALQAGVVAVLLVVVYLTILRPSDENPVSAVYMPAAPEQRVNAPQHHQRHQQKPRPRPRPHGPSARRGAQGAGAAAPAAAAGPTGPAAPAASPVAATPVSAPAGEPGGGGPEGGVPEEESPTDNQYGDTLSRLNAALR